MKNKKGDETMKHYYINGYEVSKATYKHYMRSIRMQIVDNVLLSVRLKNIDSGTSLQDLKNIKFNEVER